MYLLLLALDPGGGAGIGDPFLTIGLPIIAVAVLAIFTVLVTTILLALFYRLAFIIIMAIVRMLCLGTFIY